MLYCAYTLAAGLLLRTHPGSRTFVAHTPCMAAGNAPWQQDFCYAHILAAGLLLHTHPDSRTFVAHTSWQQDFCCAHILAAGLLLPTHPAWQQETHPGSRTFVAHTSWQQDFCCAHILAEGLYCTYTMAARICCTSAIFIFIFYVLVCLSGGVAEKRRKIKLSCCTSAGLQVIPSELQSSDILNSCLGRGTKEKKG